MGVVAKSSLSNQDFIVAENQIVQQLSTSKVVNRIKNIDIINPGMEEMFTGQRCMFCMQDMSGCTGWKSVIGWTHPHCYASLRKVLLDFNMTEDYCLEVVTKAVLAQRRGGVADAESICILQGRLSSYGFAGRQAFVNGACFQIALEA